MAFDAHCTFCDKHYRLKDELLGKKVTCANGACRKIFTAEVSANGKPAPAAPVVAPPIDAENLAAAAFADEGEAVPVDQRIIAMVCTACEHKWTVPFAMEGKNVLCPDCQTRQKVPIQKALKKADWRDGSGRPSLAKVEELEGVQASTNLKYVSGEALRQTGVIGIEYEPRPTSFYVKIGLAALGVVLLVGGLVVTSMRSREARKQGELESDFVKAIDSDEIKALAPPVAPLYRAGLHLAAAEYDARTGGQKQLEKAVRHLNEARSELERAPRGGDRDALLANMVPMAALLGGTDGEVKEKHKLPWVPQPPPPGARASIKPNPAEAEGVQGQLRRSFEARRQEKANVEYEFRIAALREVARALAKVGQTQMLLDTLQSGFYDTEQADAKAQVGLELLRAGQADAARKVAEELKGSAPTNAPPSASALWQALEPPMTGVPTVSAPSGNGEIPDATRWVFTALRMLQKNADEAKAIAARPGKCDSRMRALALAAEWSDQPGPFVDAAGEALAEELKKGEPSLPPPPVLVRLAQAAGRAGLAERAAKFAEALKDEPLRVWAKAEALRAHLQANPGIEAKGDEDAPLPTDAKKYRLGHAVARLIVARHNAQRTGERSLARKYFHDWPTNTIAPFGQAGVALGLLDAEKK